MIYTLTTNPAVDMNVNADTLTTKKVNRTREAVYTPNGKGLNVSFTLGHHGVDSVILGFFGGFSGDFYQAYRETCPMDPGYPERRDLYNLYPLLNHLHLFGSAYHHAVIRILHRYA